MKYKFGCRGLRNLVLATLVIFAFGAYAWAAPVVLPNVSVNSVTLTADTSGVTNNTYNGDAAVCSANKAAGLLVGATFTPNYTPDGTITPGSPSTCSATSNCSDAGLSAGAQTACTTAVGGGKANGYKVQTDSEVTITNTHVTSSAADTFTDNVTLTAGSGTLPLTLAIGPDGLITVTVTAYAHEDHATATRKTYTWYSTGSCNTAASGTYSDGWGSPGAPATVDSAPATNTAQYYLDVVAPTMTHVVLTPNVTQGNHQSHTTTVVGGSSQQNYDLWAEAVGPHPSDGTTLGPATLIGQTFGTNTTTGIAGNAVNTDVMFLNTLCSATPVGTYADSAKVTPTDLCGNTFADVESSSNTIDFNVVSCPAVGFIVQPDVFAPLGGPGYTGVQCYTSSLATGKGNAGKILANPGTLHAAAVLSNNTGSDQHGVTLTITIPPDFSFLLTGGSPTVHLYLGPLGSFDAETGAPLAGVPNQTSKYTVAPAKPLASQHTIVITLVNIGDGAGGTLKNGHEIFATAHVVLTSTTDAPKPNWPENFQASAHSTESGNIGPEGTYPPYVIQNPTAPESCPNGLLVPPLI